MEGRSRGPKGPGPAPPFVTKTDAELGWLFASFDTAGKFPKCVRAG
jgi:hypothetical protein